MTHQRYPRGVAADDARRARHWIAVADRASTRGIAEYSDRTCFEWSCDAALARGDVVLLYERGRREYSDQPLGRKEFGWIMRALSDPHPDAKWDQMAWFHVEPIRYPVPLAEAKRSASVSDWWAMRANLQGHGGHFEVPANAWRALKQQIKTRDPEVATIVDDWERSRPRAIDIDRLDEEADPTRDRERLPWRSERAMEPPILDLIDHEGWANAVDPADGRFGKATTKGFYLKRERWYADHLLNLGRRHLLVVEFERQAYGDPMHGAKQAADYRHALQRELPGWRVSALVIGQTFNQSELDVAAHEDVECLEASIDRRGRPHLELVGTIRGPVHDARQRATRRTSRWRVSRPRAGEPGDSTR